MPRAEVALWRIAKHTADYAATDLGGDAGNAWLAQRAAALLLVPSVIVPEEYNVLINPLHPHAGRLAASVVRQYVYDPRL